MEDYKKELATDLDLYIKDKHTQDECIGFIDGYNAAVTKFKNLTIPDVTKRSELLSFIREVANYNQPHHSRELKLKAREIEKLNCW